MIAALSTNSPRDGSDASVGMEGALRGAGDRIGRTWLVAMALVTVSSTTPHARQPTALAAEYGAAVEAYVVDGDPAPARRIAESWTQRQFEALVARTRSESPQQTRAASVLHLALALAVVESNPDNALWHVRLGQQLLADEGRASAAPGEDFVARWSVVAASIFEARTDIDRARAVLAFGLSRRPRDPRVRLHSGLIEDLASQLAENDDTGFADRKSTSARRAMYRHMANAERAYRDALSLAPTAATARIRLGRLLHRRGRFAEARQEFEYARAEALTMTERYLLLLFLSATHEAVGDTTQARAVLQECVRVGGNQQGAWLALAQFEERSGYPDRARGVIAQGLVRTRRADTDAWWDYRHGGFDSEGLTWLRDTTRAAR